MLVFVFFAVPTVANIGGTFTGDIPVYIGVQFRSHPMVFTFLKKDDEPGMWHLKLAHSKCPEIQGPRFSHLF